MKTFVIDASVSLKWILNDEIDSNIALDLQKKYFTGDINLIAPTLWTYETVNGLKTAHLKKPTLKISDLETKLDQLTNFGPNLFDISDLLNMCLKNALHFNISAYDSAYLTLAHAHEFTLITADTKLVEKINNPKLAMSLTDYVQT